jgi:hypothetical protein
MRSVGVLFDEEMFPCCCSILSCALAAFTGGNCGSTRGRSGVARIAQLDELEFDEGRLPVRWNE